MSFNSLLIHTVGVKKRVAGSTDRYGNETVAFASAANTAARVEQLTGSTSAEELLKDRDTRLTWFRIFLPPTVDVDALDQIVWGSRTFEVDGEPTTHYDSHVAHHITAIGKEIKG